MNTVSPRFIRIGDVCKTVGLGRTRVYELEKAKLFPARVKLGERVTVWREDEVSRWIEERTAESRAA